MSIEPLPLRALLLLFEENDGSSWDPMEAIDGDFLKIEEEVD
jgi:hypothetical protein